MERKERERSMGTRNLEQNLEDTLRHQLRHFFMPGDREENAKLKLSVERGIVILYFSVLGIETCVLVGRYGVGGTGVLFKQSIELCGVVL